MLSVLVIMTLLSGLVHNNLNTITNDYFTLTNTFDLDNIAYEPFKSFKTRYSLECIIQCIKLNECYCVVYAKGDAGEGNIENNCLLFDKIIEEPSLSDNQFPTEFTLYTRNCKYI